MASQGCFLFLWLALGVSLGQTKNCFTANCAHGDSPTACAAGQWQCQNHETCVMDIKHDGTVSMTCVQAHQANCPHANHAQDASCAPLVYPPQHDCGYCCDTELCARDIAAGINTPPKQGCFTPVCDHHSTLGSCMQGPWSCNVHQFCRFELHRNGDVVMQCQETDQLAHCQDATSKNLASCSHLTTLPPFSDCKYCCTNASCINNLLNHTSSSAAATTTRATAAATHAPTHAPTHAATAAATAATLTTAATGATLSSCKDSLPNNDCRNMASDCSNVVVNIVCRETCGVCASDCVDSLPNNDCHFLVADCHSEAISQVCHRTCGVCGGAPTTAALPGNPTTALPGNPTTAALPGNPTTALPGNPTTAAAPVVG